MENLTAYLQHGTGTAGPFRTESVEVRETENAPRNRNVSGYGNRIPCPYLVRYLGRWRRVYCVCYSNVGTLYIGPTSDKIIVQICRG